MPLFAVVIRHKYLTPVGFGLTAIMSVADLVRQNVLHGERINLDPLATAIHKGFNGTMATGQINGELECTRLNWVFVKWKCQKLWSGLEN